MTPHFPHEPHSNSERMRIAETEPIASRTFTPTQVVIAKSSGVFHWTPEGHQLFDFTSGVLVSNLGHHPVQWTKNYLKYLQMDKVQMKGDFFEATPLTAYNAITPIEPRRD
jgi:acetylornithine/succinyldiaminopimelate/putrescine aminotransferase